MTDFIFSGLFNCHLTYSPEINERILHLLKKSQPICKDELISIFIETCINNVEIESTTKLVDAHINRLIHTGKIKRVNDRLLEVV